MPYNVLDSEGRIIGWVSTAEEATALLDSVPDDVYTFFVGGLPEDVSALMLTLNRTGERQSFFEWLATKYGRVPATIIPFDEIRQYFLKHNAVFIKVHPLRQPEMAKQLLGVLHRTIPAGSGFFVILELDTVSEGITLSSDAEEVIVFYSLEEDEGASVAGEHTFTSSVL